MNITDEILKNTSLESKLKVMNEMAFINLITELGYRKDRMWTDSENDLLQKLCDLAKEHTDNIIKKINEHGKI